ncbi:ABC transporter substrate-binding protein, partial [Streptomyces sp. NPDC056728]
AGVPKFNQKNKVGIMMMQWGADWPSGYGFLQQILNSKAIGESGNTALSELDDKKVDSMLAEAIAAPDEATRNKLYGQIDKQAMEDAALVPLTYFKVLMYRSPYATNLVSTAAFSGQYDYLNIGTTKK